jgi:hypothetical protein
MFTFFLHQTCTTILAGNEIGMGRSFGISNISLVITYTTVVIAALMLAGFLWMAFAYSGQSSSGYGRRKRDAFNVNEGTHKLTYVHQCFTFIKKMIQKLLKWRNYASLHD